MTSSDVAPAGPDAGRDTLGDSISPFDVADDADVVPRDASLVDIAEVAEFDAARSGDDAADAPSPPVDAAADAPPPVDVAADDPATILQPLGHYCRRDADCVSSHCSPTLSRCTSACTTNADCPNADWTCGDAGVCECTPSGDYSDFCDGHDNDCDSVVDQIPSCGPGTCVAGACVCPAGYTACGPFCEDLTTSTQNCGTCGNRCEPVQVCASGTCACPGGTTWCPAMMACDDLSRSSVNCGACGVRCPGSAMCRAGTCACNTAGQSVCGDECVDLATSPSHCGACGTVCPSGASCVSGTCACPASAPTVCANTCESLATDPANCGVCGATCPIACSASACTTVAEVAVGDLRCARLADGTVRCAAGIYWSWPSTWRIPIGGVAGAVQVDAGGDFGCARLADRTVRCWGDNSDGQLGDGGLDSTGATSVAVSGLDDVVQIALGGSHACARRGTGELACWGRDDHGQVGDGLVGRAIVPETVVGLAHVSDVAAGSEHTCATTDAGVACWGWNEYGQLGDGTTTDRYMPTAVPGLPAGTRIAAGNSHTCALLPGGTVQCWGNNQASQLGDGSTVPFRAIPGVVPGLTSVVQLEAGDDYTCARFADGSLACWGRLSGGAPVVPVPTSVSGATHIASFDAGHSGVCALQADGSLACWLGSDAPTRVAF